MSTIIRDFKNNVTLGVSLTFATRTGATNGNGVDLVNTESQCFAIVVTGTITDGTHVITLEESKNNNSADASGAAEAFAAVPAQDSQSIVAADDDTFKVINFSRSKRYVRAVTTPSGTTTGGAYAILVGGNKKIY